MIFVGLVLLSLALGLGIGLSNNENITEKCIDSKHGKCYKNGAVATDDARYLLFRVDFVDQLCIKDVRR